MLLSALRITVSAVILRIVVSVPAQALDATYTHAQRCHLSKRCSPRAAE